MLSTILVTIGLIFILGTLIPNGNVGLQFSIAYTGGTVWEVHFEDGAPDPVDVRAVLEEQGLPNSEVAITGSDDRDYVLIRTEALTLVETELTEGSAAAALAAEASASPGASTGPTPSDAPFASKSPSASTEPAASATPLTSEAPVASDGSDRESRSE